MDQRSAQKNKQGISSRNGASEHASCSLLIRPRIIVPYIMLDCIFLRHTPVITFSSILYAVALTTPFNLLKWLLEALFPLYVFCGVACITGGLLGLCGRFLCSIIVKSLSAERLQKGKKYHQGTLKTSDVDPDVRSAKSREGSET